MINKLKRKFLIIGTVSMFILMAVLVLIMNIVNYREVTSDADSVLDVLTQPNMPIFNEGAPPEKPEEITGFMPPGMSLEVPYESRFFDARVSEDGDILQYDLSRIVSVDNESAQKYIRAALESSHDRGFIDSFRYLKTADEKGTRILFLDCGRKLDSYRSFLWTSVIVGLIGCLAVFVAFIFAAGKVVAPIAESYEKQKRFISDAGHEIKTPLTIINANVDLLECDGEKEELTDIRTQTKRLTELTNNLVMLSKMEEAEHAFQKIEFPLSDLVSETVGSFRAPAASRGLDLEVSITPGITMNGSPDMIRQLVSVLLDNAVKYSPDGEKITAELSAQRKTVTFSVENASSEKLSGEDLDRVFDRFYRTDKSRNSETGGHGIGLSIAKAVTEAHGGSISAASKTGYDFCVTVCLPV
ncbi:MAG: HAMP domain-containing histidine kinase [Lachnospiraceae bacterium]|nr:HAMP domain-containing histidine kinase [Lachnospiraceae bacterium]